MAVHGLKPENSGSEKGQDRKLDDKQVKALDIALQQARKRKAEQFKNKV